MRALVSLMDLTVDRRMKLPLIKTFENTVSYEQLLFYILDLLFNGEATPIPL